MKKVLIIMVAIALVIIAVQVEAKGVFRVINGVGYIFTDNGDGTWTTEQFGAQGDYPMGDVKATDKFNCPNSISNKKITVCDQYRQTCYPDIMSYIRDGNIIRFCYNNGSTLEDHTIACPIVY